MATLLQHLKGNIWGLKEEIKKTEKMIAFCKQLKKNTLVYTEYLQIRVARDGVAAYIPSKEPALLRYAGWHWGGQAHPVTLEFDVLASEDPEPYGPPYQLPFSGQDARCKNPDESMRIVQPKDLILYVHFKFKTKHFEQLLKKESESWPSKNMSSSKATENCPSSQPTTPQTME